MSVAGTANQGRTELVAKYRVHDKDTGSPEVQIALLTNRIDTLAEHFKGHNQDLHSQRGLMRLVAQRKSLLAYLKRESSDRYKNLIGSLGLRK